MKKIYCAILSQNYSVLSREQDMVIHMALLLHIADLEGTLLGHTKSNLSLINIARLETFYEFLLLHTCDH